MPVMVCRVELSSSTGPTNALTPTASKNERRKTMVEWPRENQKPTERGLRSMPAWALSAISLRVVLSTAAMWSASKACRRPSV